MAMRRSFAWKSQARAAVAEDNLQREAFTATIRVESTYGKGKHKNMKPFDLVRDINQPILVVKNPKHFYRKKKNFIEQPH